MAREKKAEKVLTPEEKLAQVLVPVEEQPYPVPENWCWVKLSSICRDIRAGGDKPKNMIETKSDSYSVPVIANGIQNDGIIGYTDMETASAGTVTVAGRGTIGFSLARSYPYYPVVRLIVLSPKDFVIPTYLKYIFDIFEEHGTGSSIPQLTVPAISTKKIPLPPLTEQQRIVARIERLFAKLVEAKEKAQAVVDSFETRKAAILHKAFTGELTAQWRQKNNVELDSWQRITIEDMCHSLKYGTAKKSQDHGTVAVIRMGNLQHGEIDWTNLAYTDDKEDIEKYRLLPGDVLFNRTNSPELVGKTSIYRGEYPAIYAGYLIKLDYDHDQILGDYFNYVLNSTAAKEYCNAVKTDGVNQSNINAKKIGAFVIPVPTISEQNEIISVVKSIFAKEQQAKEAAEGVLDQIETMKKSILARAFRGELGTNDPVEENAVELLKEIL